MTPEQIQKISALGYIVVNMGQYVEDTNKNIVISKDAEGNYVTEVAKLQTILAAPVKETKPKAKKKTKKTEKEALEMVRARDEKGHYIADDPDTEVNEAWVVKTVKKVIKKK